MHTFQMGIREIVSLGASGLGRYVVVAEGDRLRLVNACQEHLKRSKSYFKRYYHICVLGRGSGVKLNMCFIVFCHVKDRRELLYGVRCMWLLNYWPFQ